MRMLASPPFTDDPVQDAENWDKYLEKLAELEEEEDDDDPDYRPAWSLSKDWYYD